MFFGNIKLISILNTTMPKTIAQRAVEKVYRELRDHHDIGVVFKQHFETPEQLWELCQDVRAKKSVPMEHRCHARTSQGDQCSWTWTTYLTAENDDGEPVHLYMCKTHLAKFMRMNGDLDFEVIPAKDDVHKRAMQFIEDLKTECMEDGCGDRASRVPKKGKGAPLEPSKWCKPVYCKTHAPRGSCIVGTLE